MRFLSCAIKILKNKNAPNIANSFESSQDGTFIWKPHRPELYCSQIIVQYTLLYFKKLFLYDFMCMHFILCRLVCMYICTPSVCLLPEEASKRHQSSVELELQMVLGHHHHVGVGN